MIRGTRREDRLARKRLYHPDPEDLDPSDRRILSVGGALIVIVCLALLIRWLQL